MKKHYITPSTRTTRIQLQSMVCESLSIYSTEVDASKALGRRNDDDLWEDEE